MAHIGKISFSVFCDRFGKGIQRVHGYNLYGLKLASTSLPTWKHVWQIGIYYNSMWNLLIGLTQIKTVNIV